MKAVSKARALDLLQDQRWPAQQTLELVIDSSGDDRATVQDLLEGLIVEVVAMWPSGTYWVMQIGPQHDRTYLQGRRDGSALQLEFGEAWQDSASTGDWSAAKRLGWMNPHAPPEPETLCVTRAAWADNPVMEVSTTDVPTWEIAEKLSTTATSLLGTTADCELTVKVWINEEDENRPRPAGTDKESDTIRVRWRGGRHPFGSFAWKSDIDGFRCLVAMDGIPEGVELVLTDRSGTERDITHQGQRVVVYGSPIGPGWYFDEGLLLRFIRGHVVVEATTRD